MKPIKTDATILRSVDYRDSDRIFTLLTRDLGMISAMARGVRKSHKRYDGALVPFAHIEIVVSPGAGRMWHIKEAALLQPNAALSAHLLKVSSSSYLLEITRESIPENTPDIPLFELVLQSLEALCLAAPESVPMLTLSATLKLLRLSGIAIGLSRCSSCGQMVPAGRPVLFHPGRGGVICTPCGGGPFRLEADTIGALQQMADIRMDADEQLAFAPQTIRQCEEAVLDFIEHHLGRRLKTRTFLRQMDKLSPEGTL